eukprot:m51a1_g3637 hypothetical protein (674) ;mRNA; f:156303-158835
MKTLTLVSLLLYLGALATLLVLPISPPSASAARGARRVLVQPADSVDDPSNEQSSDTGAIDSFDSFDSSSNSDGSQGLPSTVLIGRHARALHTLPCVIACGCIAAGIVAGVTLCSTVAHRDRWARRTASAEDNAEDDAKKCPDESSVCVDMAVATGSGGADSDTPNSCSSDASDASAQRGSSSSADLLDNACGEAASSLSGITVAVDTLALAEAAVTGEGHSADRTELGIGCNAAEDSAPSFPAPPSPSAASASGGGDAMDPCDSGAADVVTRRSHDAQDDNQITATDDHSVHSGTISDGRIAGSASDDQAPATSSGVQSEDSPAREATLSETAPQCAAADAVISEHSDLGAAAGQDETMEAAAQESDTSKPPEKPQDSDTDERHDPHNGSSEPQLQHSLCGTADLADTRQGDTDAQAAGEDKCGVSDVCPTPTPAVVVVPEKQPDDATSEGEHEMARALEILVAINDACGAHVRRASQFAREVARARELRDRPLLPALHRAGSGHAQAPGGERRSDGEARRAFEEMAEALEAMEEAHRAAGAQLRAAVEARTWGEADDVSLFVAMAPLESRRATQAYAAMGRRREAWGRLMAELRGSSRAFARLSADFEGRSSLTPEEAVAVLPLERLELLMMLSAEADKATPSTEPRGHGLGEQRAWLLRAALCTADAVRV